MAYILTLLFAIPFVGRKETRWFLFLYAFILLAANDIRVLLGYSGTELYSFYSDTQLVLASISIYFLRGTERALSAGLFCTFSLYNIFIVWMWGEIPIFYHKQISIAVVLMQLGIVTYKNTGFLKNMGIIVSSIYMGHLFAEYI